MKKTLLYALISILLIACGPTEKEIEAHQAFLTDSLRQVSILDSINRTNALRAEAIRVHEENIEVGKSLKKTWIEGYLLEINQKINAAKAKLSRIDEFEIGRLQSTKDRQLSTQRQVISKLRVTKSSIETEIAKSNLFNSYDFQLTPKGTVEHLFAAAKNNDFNKVRYLSDPYGECEKDVYELCLVEAFSQDLKEEWVSQFSSGRVMGEPKVEDNSAEIEVAIGPDSKILQKIKLIKRLDHWYIFGF